MANACGSVSSTLTALSLVPHIISLCILINSDTVTWGLSAVFRLQRIRVRIPCCILSLRKHTAHGRHSSTIIHDAHLPYDFFPAICPCLYFYINLITLHDWSNSAREEILIFYFVNTITLSWPLTYMHVCQLAVAWAVALGCWHCRLWLRHWHLTLPKLFVRKRNL